MSTETITHKFYKNINAPISQVYSAFTNATLLREWFCEIATTKPSPGGRFYAGWNNNYYIVGDFISVEKDLLIELNWLGKDDPGKTKVKISLSQAGSGTNVNIEHSGIGSDKEWEHSSHEITKGWETSLDNLKSTLETGEDLRIVRRPMLGVVIGNVDSNGVIIDDVIKEMGAYECGIQKGDVIKIFAGVTITDFPLLTNTLNKYHAGDSVEVEYYRGAEKKTSTLKLSSRKLPVVSWNPSDFATEIEKIHKEVEKQLAELLVDVTEAEASHKPGKDEWNVKEIIAHLIHGQRYYFNWVSNLLGSQEPAADDYSGNQNATVEATVMVYPTLQNIVDEFSRCNSELVKLIAGLPDEFVARKSSYWRVAFVLMEDPYHFYNHADQIKAAITHAKENH